MRRTPNSTRTSFSVPGNDPDVRGVFEAIIGAGADGISRKELREKTASIVADKRDSVLSELVTSGAVTIKRGRIRAAAAPK
jgi:hypothetical protein